MKKAFTLAEVLITLAIIGVVAALTIPTVMNNTQKRIYVTQLKKNYSNITQAFKNSMAKEGVFTLSDTSLFVKLPNNTNNTESTIADNPNLKEEFTKIFNVVSIHSEDNLPNKYSINYLNGNEYEEITSGIILAGGTLLRVFLNKVPDVAKCNGQTCRTLSELQKYHGPAKLLRSLGSIEIDVNGSKKPNVTGRDIFFFEIGDDGNLYPYGGRDYAVFYSDDCKYSDIDVRGNNTSTNCPFHWSVSNSLEYGCNPDDTTPDNGQGCAARVIEQGWEMRY